MRDDDDTQTYANDSATSSSISTGLAQGCSGFDPVSTSRALVVIPTERPRYDFGLENARRYFIAQREFEGADTPIGHRWSNLVELSQAIYGSTDPVQREHCMVSFAKNLGDILDLKLARPARTLPRSQLLLAYSTNTFH